MNEVKLFESITVDETQNVERAIYDLCGKRVDFETVRRFITTEKNTVFFFDKKMNSSTAAGTYSGFVWLDTGYRDYYNNPILIFLKYTGNGFCGHYTGTMRTLANYVKQTYWKNAREFENNYSRFVSKYKQRASERKSEYITDDRKYVIEAANRDTESDSAFAAALKLAGYELPAAAREKAEETSLQSENNLSDEKMMKSAEESMTAVQKEITMELLFDQIDSMQNYIDELLSKLENREKQTQQEITELKAQNEDYRKAMLNIRTFMQSESTEVTEMMEGIGHRLLGRNKKILVLGNTDIREDEMRAIARDYFGFEKNDLEFVTDYAKIRNDGQRIHNSDRFAAVVFGNCPHKVAGMGDHSSVIEEFKKNKNCRISIDARNKAGGLKITKQSFKEALKSVCEELKLQVA